MSTYVGPSMFVARQWPRREAAEPFVPSVAVLILVSLLRTPLRHTRAFRWLA